MRAYSSQTVNERCDMDMRIVIRLCESAYSNRFGGSSIRIVECSDSKIGYGLDLSDIPTDQHSLVSARFNKILEEVCTIIAYSSKDDLRYYMSGKQVSLSIN